MEDENKDGLTNGKCIECGACGHSGCCGPLDCKMTNNSIYCRKYLQELRSAYMVYQKMYSLILDNQEKYPELFVALQDMCDDAEDVRNI